jgi:hypothetical protein
MHLPTLNVIPFQIQQLFTNLIGNSIKYEMPDDPLVIRIREKVTGPEQHALKLVGNRKYYKNWKTMELVLNNIMQTHFCTLSTFTIMMSMRAPGSVKDMQEDR